MLNQDPLKTELKPEEDKELREGQEIYEMSQSAGWGHIKRWLEDLAFHSWVNPIEIDSPNPEETWKWRELNAFHAANNAKELLEKIQKSISHFEYLEKIKSGKIQRRSMKF